MREFQLVSLGNRKRKLKGRGASGIGKRAGRGNKGTGQRNRGRTKIRLQFGHESSFLRKHPKVGFYSKRQGITVKHSDLIHQLRKRGTLGPEVSVDRGVLIDLKMVSASKLRQGSYVKLVGPSVDPCRLRLGKGIRYSASLSKLVVGNEQ